jgi:hypothetical protein
MSEPPTPTDFYDELFSHLDEKLKAQGGCDHTLRHTKAFITSFTNLGVQRTLEWFEEHGGHCDCEVILNVLLDRISKPDDDGATLV